MKTFSTYKFNGKELASIVAQHLCNTNIDYRKKFGGKEVVFDMNIKQHDNGFGEDDVEVTITIENP